jgi:hypothetical protein
MAVFETGFESGAVKAALVDRLQKLQGKKQQIVAEAQAQVAGINAQIAALQELAGSFSTLPLDQALDKLSQSGVRLRLDA